MAANRPRLSVPTAFFTVLTMAVCFSAQADPYEYKAGNLDGIGKYYYYREIARVMGYEGAHVFFS